MVRVDAPGGFDPAVVCSWFAELGEHAQSEELVFHLPAELSPGVAVLLSATIVARAQHGWPTKFEQRGDPRTALPGRAVPATQFSEAIAVRRFAADAARRIARLRAGSDRLFEGELARILHELGDNVLRHAQTADGGWSCA